MELVEIYGGVVQGSTDGVLIVDWDDIRDIRSRFDSGAAITSEKVEPRIHPHEIEAVEALIGDLLSEGYNGVAQDIQSHLKDVLNAAHAAA